jgi:hypothetical protein
MKQFIFIALLFVGLCFSACKKDPVDSPRKNYLTADLEGKTFSKATYKAVDYNNISDTMFIYISSNSGAYYMSLSINVDLNAGVYNAMDEPYGFACGPYPIENQNNTYVPILETAMLTINEKDASAKWIEGSFMLQAYHALLLDTIDITNGQYGVFYE